MKKTTLFVDIGQVFLTNGWDRLSRQKAAEKFDLDLAECNERHSLIFDIYQMGKVDLQTYLDRVIFYKERLFTHGQFIDFMFGQSQKLDDMIALLKEYKSRYSLKIVALSNEGKELADYRIKAFNLKEWIDFFVVSCYVGMIKPDPGIYQLALNIAQVEAKEVVYIDDRLLFTECAAKLGFEVIHHETTAKTKAKLEAFFSC